MEKPNQPTEQTKPAVAHTSSPSKAFLILLGFIVFVVVSTVAYFLGVKNTQLAPQQQAACTKDAKVCPDGVTVGRVPPSCDFAQCLPAKDSTANWKTYTNTKYMYSFKYPQTWRISSPNDAGAMFITSRPTTKKASGDFTPGMGWITVSIISTAKDTVLNTVPGEQSRNTTAISNISATELKGHSGVAGTMYFDTVIFEHNGKSYEFSLTTQDTDLEQVLTSEFHQILSTFTLVSPAGGDKAQTVDTNTWKTYAGDGFSFKYPSIYSVTASVLQKSPSDSFDIWITSRENKYTTVYSKKDSQINGHATVIQETASFPIGREMKAYIMKDAITIIYIIGTPISQNDPAKAFSQDTQNQFDQILSTFTFTNQNSVVTPTCMQRPACLDATPRCLVAEPVNGWCPTSPK